MPSIPNQFSDETGTNQQSLAVQLATVVFDNERAVRQFLDSLLSTTFTGDPQEIRSFGSIDILTCLKSG